MPGFAGVRLGLLGAAICLAVPAWGAAAWRFDIEAQSLSSALAAFARQSGLQLVYYSELASRRRSPGLEGVHTAADALAILLKDSELTFVLLDDHTVSIEPALRDAGQTPASQVAAPPVLAAPSTTDPGIRTPLPAAEEVVVTARRREESLQEVPIAVTVFGTEQLAARNVGNTEALNRQIPNVAVAGGNFFGRQSGVFRMRGVPGVAIYVDGVVQGGAVGALQNVVELERIEVLRGPQGTLFGKNAVGGAIQYLSEKPRDKPGARARVSAGSFGRRDVIANADLPLADGLLTKMTFASLSREGYLLSTTVDRTFGSQDDLVGRLVVSWRPLDALQLFAYGEYTEQETNGNPSTVWSLNPVCAGDPLPSNYLGSAPNNPCVYEAVGLSIPQEWVQGARKEWRTASDYLGPDIETVTRSLKADATLDFGNAWSLKTIAGYREIDSAGYADFDGTPYKLFDGFNYGERRERSLELQALYAAGKLRGTTGLYYYNDRTRGRRMNWLANDLHAGVDPALNAAARAYFPLFGSPGNAGSSVLNGLTHSSSEGWAMFAEWTFAFGSGFSLSAGARYNEDTIRTAAYPTADALDVRCCVPSFNLDAGGPAIPNQSGSATFTEVSPRVSLQYQWTPALMGYLSYARGFGAGGFTGGNIPDEPAGGFDSFGPERLMNYEAGLRSVWLDGRVRLNMSAFFGEYDDIQVAEEVIPRFPTTTNAGKAEIRGVEIEGMWSPWAMLSVNYGAAWLDTAYTDLGQVTNIRRDSSFAYAPRFSWTVGAQYLWRTEAGGQFILRGDYGWQDDVIATLDINTGSSIPAYGLASARLAYRSPSGRWDVALAGTNLFDEYYRINGFFIPADQMDNGTLGRPREWALTLGFLFD